MLNIWLMVIAILNENNVVDLCSIIKSIRIYSIEQQQQIHFSIETLIHFKRIFFMAQSNVFLIRRIIYNITRATCIYISTYPLLLLLMRSWCFVYMFQFFLFFLFDQTRMLVSFLIE